MRSPTLVVSALIMAGTLLANGHANPANAKTCKSNQQTSGTDLADNTQAQAAAKILGSQIVGQYNSYSSRNAGNVTGFVPNISSFTADFNAAILSLLSPSEVLPTTCELAPVALAVATTSQTNKQNGSSSTASGSTSVTDKTAVTQLLGIAVQNGAINNNVTGNAMTLSTSAYGVFTGFGLIEDTATNYGAWGPLTRLGASATFNLTNASSSSSSSSATTTSNTLASANHRQASQWQIKFPFRDTSIRSAAVTNIFYGLGKSEPSGAANGLKSAVDTSLDARSKAVLKDLSSLLQIDPTLRRIGSFLTSQSAAQDMWIAVKSEVEKTPDCSATTSSSAKPAADPCKALEQSILKWLASYKSSGTESTTYIAQAEVALRDLSLQKLIRQYSTDEASFLATDKQFETNVKNLQAGWNGALTFTEQYPTTGGTTKTTNTTGTTSTTTKPSQPAYLISGLDISWQKKKADTIGTETSQGSSQASPWPAMTINLAGSVYPNPSATLNEQTFRGGTAATTLQWDLGKSPFLGSAVDQSQITVELSGQYQRLQENEDQKGKKADLVLGNFKLEFPISSGVSFPLSMTVANSSEEVKETYVKGNFGMSFDLDKLASLLKAKQ